jgi:hypothetical protein
MRIQALAEDDVSQAFEWYESQRTNLGTDLLSDLEICLKRIALAPNACPRGSRIRPPRTPQAVPILRLFCP